MRYGPLGRQAILTGIGIPPGSDLRLAGSALGALAPTLSRTVSTSRTDDSGLAGLSGHHEAALSDHRVAGHPVGPVGPGAPLGPGVPSSPQSSGVSFTLHVPLRIVPLLLAQEGTRSGSPSCAGVEKDRSASAVPSVHCAHASSTLDLGALHSRRRPMREPGAVLLVACYELGHQPLTLAWPAAFLERRGYAPAVMDLAVEPFDAEKVRRTREVAVCVHLHTAMT